MVIEKIHSLAEDWELAWGKCDQEFVTSTPFSCQRRGQGFVELDVDDSSLGNLGRSGFDGLISSSDGAYLVGFTGIKCNLLPELLAWNVF